MQRWKRKEFFPLLFSGNEDSLPDNTKNAHDMKSKISRR